MNKRKIWLIVVVLSAVVISGIFRERRSPLAGQWVTEKPDGALVFQADGTGESIAGIHDYFEYSFEPDSNELTMSWSESFAEDESRPKRYAVKFIGQNRMVLGPPNGNFHSWSIAYTRKEPN